VPHDQVPALIAHADAVAYTSLYETFGLPVLEALASGRPVVTSGRGATAEVAGGAARLVDVSDVDDIAAGLADVLLNEALRRDLTTAGPRRASTFTWSACSQKTADVLEQAVSRHGSPRGRRRARPAGPASP
jgi:glycosyltransferase involved in cell wall biosynthesis